MISQRYNNLQLRKAMPGFHFLKIGTVERGKEDKYAILKINIVCVAG